MSEKTQHIDICIASYKRPQLLGRLLKSIANQRIPIGVTVGIIVVDNDPAGSAVDVVQNASRAGQPVRYFMQPKKNIALTRNMAAANADGEYIAYIDDDEYAEENWLTHLYDTLQKYQADMVFGPVICEVPENAPSWLVNGRFFEWKRYKTGTEIPGRGTGNVLIRADSIPDRRAPFNPKYGLSGGEDTDFFRRMQMTGAKLIWCDEAVARETLVPERFSVGFLIRRAFRHGQIFAEIYVKPKSLLRKVPWFFYRIVLVVIALIGALVSWPFRKAWGIKCFQKVASNVGQLSSVFPYRYQEYGEN
ncbi:MAG: glycosyltransferase family 2 protein [Burkholderiales bacterium]